MELAQRLRRITRKLADIAGMSDKVEALEKFGEPDHGFRLGPPLEVERVAEFERRHGVVLPAEHRAFITRVGHQGCGVMSLLVVAGEGRGRIVALLQDAQWLLGRLRQKQSSYQRAMAAVSLGNHIAAPGVRAALHATAVGDTDDSVRVAVLAVLGEHPAREDTRVVRAALEDPSPQVRMAASWALPDA